MARYAKEERDSRIGDTRSKLLTAALAEFTAHGPHLANLDRMAQAAGVAKGTIYNHFADKAGLFLAVLDTEAARHCAWMREALSAAPDPVRALDAFFAANAAFVEGHLPAARLLAGVAQGMDEALKTRLNDCYRPLFDLLASAVLVPGVTAGLFRPLDLPRTATLVMTLLLATSSQVDAHGRPWMSPAEVSGFVRHALLAAPFPQRPKGETL